MADASKEYEAVSVEMSPKSVNISEKDADKHDSKCSDWSLFFQDGKTRIDFVLAYNASENDPVRLRKREIFEANLLAEKLILERDEQDSRPVTALNSGSLSQATIDNPKIDTNANAEQATDNKPRPSAAVRVGSVSYLKVHAPYEVLAKYAEVLKMQMPVKQSVDRFVQKARVLRTADCRALLEQHDTESHTLLDNSGSTSETTQPNCCQRLLRAINVYPTLDPLPRRYAVPFSTHRSYLFDLNDRENFFDSKDRSFIVEYILQRKSYTRMPTSADSALTSIEPPEDDTKAAQGQAQVPPSCGPEQQGPAEQPDAATSQANDLGVNRLLKDKVYMAAFPLHDCPLNQKRCNSSEEDYSYCMRYQLWREWADFRNAIKMQPLNHIQRYFGDAIAWYFAWLGFYTQWLIPLAVVGIFIFVYGLLTCRDEKVLAFCNANTTMCPLCLKGCPYWQVSSQCFNMMVGRIFENPLTFVWGVVVTMWCTLFLENWKRRQYALRFEWNLFSIEKDEEPPRPEFSVLSQDSKKRFKTRPHPITGRQEPHVPYWSSLLPSYAISITTVLFGMLLVMAAVAGVVVYRVVIQTVVFKSGSSFMSSYGSILASVTGAMINLFLIMALGFVYNFIATWLTDREYWRTQTEYDNALMAKLVALQCVNYYSSVVYIAFLKGQFATVSNYVQLKGSDTDLTVDFTIDMCTSGSCLPDLCIQLTIIMCYKQLIQNNVLEILLPKFKKWLSLYMKRRQIKKLVDAGQANLVDEFEGNEGGSRACRSPTLHDNYKLQEVGARPLFGEYLEMVIQYGFVSIFAIAFPLAPLFALLNNILEIRIDARKFLVDLRRPVAEFDVDIGIWYQVLYLLARVAILTNGALIAFTSELIPNLVYILTPEYSSGTGIRDTFNYTLYTSFSYSILETNVFNLAGASANRTLRRKDGSEIITDPITCMYKGYHNPPNSVAPAVPYEFSKTFWHVLAWRIAVFVIFENAIVVLTELVAYLIPDVPSAIEQRQRKERHLMRRLILKADTLVALKQRPPKAADDSAPPATATATAPVVSRLNKRTSGGVRLPSVLSDKDVAIQQTIIANVKRRSTAEDLEQAVEEMEMQTMQPTQAAVESPTQQQPPSPQASPSLALSATESLQPLIQRPIGLVPDE